MPRYIDADALLDEITPGKIILSNSVRYKIITAPTADVERVKHGKWTISEYEYFDCSVCGESYYTGAESMAMAERWLRDGLAYRICPHCGAEMDEEEEHQYMSFDEEEDDAEVVH